MSPDVTDGRRVYVVDARRTPFLRSGSALKKQTAYDLGRTAIAALLHKTGIDPETIERVAMGTVVADPDTSNVAREAALAARDFAYDSLGWTTAISLIVEPADVTSSIASASYSAQ